MNMEQARVVIERVGHALESSPLGRQFLRFPCFGIILVSSVFLFLLSLGAGSDKVLPIFAASPSATLMNGRIWTLLTSAVVEINLTKYGIFLAFALVASYKLESEGGSADLAKVLAFSCVVSSFLSALTFVAVYMLTLNDQIFFSHVFGLGGVVVTLVVYAMKRSQKGSNILGSVITQDRFFLLPLSLVGYGLLGLRFPLHDALLVVFSFFSSVGFLRSDDFHFGLFLPRRSVSGSISISASPSITSVGGLKASVDPTKERLRARGFKLLDKKLAELEATPEVPLDLGESLKSESISLKV